MEGWEVHNLETETFRFSSLLSPTVRFLLQEPGTENQPSLGDHHVVIADWRRPPFLGFVD